MFVIWRDVDGVAHIRSHPNVYRLEVYLIQFANTALSLSSKFVESSETINVLFFTSSYDQRWPFCHPKHFLFAHLKLPYWKHSKYRESSHTTSEPSSRASWYGTNISRCTLEGLRCDSIQLVPVQLQDNSRRGGGYTQEPRQVDCKAITRNDDSLWACLVLSPTRTLRCCARYECLELSAIHIHSSTRPGDRSRQLHRFETLRTFTSHLEGAHSTIH